MLIIPPVIHLILSLLRHVFFQYDNLDGEHQALFKCIATCALQPSDAAALAKLVQVTVDHFADEEVCIFRRNSNFAGILIVQVAFIS